MKRGLLPIVLLSLLLPASVASPQSFGEWARRLPDHVEPPNLTTRRISFGREPGQRIAFNPAREEGAPIVVTLAGDGWPNDQFDISLDWLPSRYIEKGYAHASIGHRPMPRWSVADALSDYAAGLAKLRAEAAKRGIDTDRIVLVGSGMGSHFAAMLALDPAILEAAGVPFASIRGVILFEPPNPDIVDRIANGDRVRAVQLARIFGEEVAAQRRLSPTSHVEEPNAPAFLIVRSERSGGSRATDLGGFMAALRAAGSTVEALDVPPSYPDVHASNVGTASNPATPIVDAFFAEALSQD